MDREISDLHKQIKSLMNEKVGGGTSANGNGASGGMSAGERKMLAKARQACGPNCGGEWRKAAF